MKNQKLGLLALLLALLMSLSVLFVACKDDEEPTPPPEESGEEESGLPELEKIPTTPVQAPAGTMRVAFDDYSVTSAPKQQYDVRISPDFEGAGSLVVTVSQGENANIAVSGADDSDEAATTVTKAVTENELRTEYTVQVSGAEVGDFDISATFTLAGAEGVVTTVAQTLSVRHTLSVSPQDILALEGGSRALTATASKEDAEITWTGANEAVTLSAATGATVNANLAGKGTATITASYSYTPYGAAEAITVSDSVDITVSERLATVPSVIADEDLLAFADFDFDEGTALDLQTSTVNTGITATYSTNSTQSDTAKTGKAFKVSNGGSFKNEKITLSFSGVTLTAQEGISFSFWHKNAGTEDTPADWSVIAETAAIGSTVGKRVCFINLNYDISIANNGGGIYPAAHGTLTNGGDWNSMITNTEWTYITVVLSTEGAFFYENGVKLCSYTIDNAKSIVEGFVAQINANGSITLFGNNECSAPFYVDELLVAKGMTDSEVAALYNAVNPANEA